MSLLPLIASLLPTDASAHGPALDHQLQLSLWITLGLAVLAHLLLIVGLVGRRTQARSSLWAIEYLPLTLLIILFATLGIRAERLWALTRYTGASHEAMQMEATGLQFAWYFRYTGPDATFGITRPQLASAAEGNPLGIDAHDSHGADDLVTTELVIPVDREIDLTLRAQDVIHGFAVPELRLKQNAVPGETTHIHFTATKTGTFAILCTQLCGLGHYRMSANLRVLPVDEFQRWLTQREQAAHP
ncbi:MAG: cytochrome C oxidase subunit II [Edaphobacter sp.]|uniref:cytochrome c oxidase subunit II n=1 Tax=Edaphobacter sp. TaxID=1934404 RepID=UPI00238D3AA9|nr:cytochrome C oxidase subunit II [Edaphobacter sp.]MDE1175557.1 cytochrome C oxidase subunit II [Edaphobacter sp.]